MNRLLEAVIPRLDRLCIYLDRRSRKFLRANSFAVIFTLLLNMVALLIIARDLDAKARNLNSLRDGLINLAGATRLFVNTMVDITIGIARQQKETVDQLGHHETVIAALLHNEKDKPQIEAISEKWERERIRFVDEYKMTTAALETEKQVYLESMDARFKEMENTVYERMDKERKMTFQYLSLLVAIVIASGLVNKIGSKKAA